MVSSPTVGKRRDHGVPDQPGLKKDKESDDVLVIGGAIYARDHQRRYYQEDRIGLCRRRNGSVPFSPKGKKPVIQKGVVEGTLSFESIHWDHPERSADILVDENWDDRKNDKGYAGTSFSQEWPVTVD